MKIEHTAGKKPQISTLEWFFGTHFASWHKLILPSIEKLLREWVTGHSNKERKHNKRLQQLFGTLAQITKARPKQKQNEPTNNNTTTSKTKMELHSINFTSFTTEIYKTTKLESLVPSKEGSTVKDFTLSFIYFCI